MKLEGLVFRLSKSGEPEEYRLDLGDGATAEYARFYLGRQEMEKFIKALQTVLNITDNTSIRWGGEDENL